MLLTENLIGAMHTPARRIVSLVPSQTELLHDLGLDAEVIGITKFCIHPESWFRSKQRVGGTKTVDVAKVLSLQPDLIIANKEENEAEQVLKLAEEIPCYVSDVYNLESATDMIATIGQLTGTLEKAQQIIGSINSSFMQLPADLTPRRVAYFIWKDPWMTIGRDTFINDMLQRLNWQNVFASDTRYPEISLETLQQAQPEIVLLSSEPYPFKEKHREELKGILPGSEILLVDGEMFSWYGSRLVQAAVYFRQLLNSVAAQ